MLQHLLLLAVFTNGVTMAPTAFTCPTNHITITSGVSGVLPAGATDMVSVPKGVDCTYKFDMPTGYALKLSTKSTYNPSKDDMINFNNDYYLDTYGENFYTDFAVGNTVTLEVRANSDAVKFIAKYSFVDMSHYTQKNFTTGQYFSTTIEKNKYYTIWASEGDHVSMRVSDRAGSTIVDFQPTHVFVYEGPDISLKYYLGRLSKIERDFWYSDDRSLTFVNLYEDETSNSIILGNDFSKVKDYETYFVEWVDPTISTPLWIGSPNLRTEDNFAYTIICEKCDNFYLSSFDFDNRTADDGYITIQGMTPTDNLSPLITYQYNQYSLPTDSLPQYIPARIVTVYTKRAYAKILMSADMNQQWLAPYYHRNGVLAAPKSWDPINEQKFDYTFKDGKGGRYNYRLSIDSVALGSGDKLTMTIGSGNGIPVFTKTLTSIDSKGLNYGATGEYLTVSYQGSEGNDLKMKFYSFQP